MQRRKEPVVVLKRFRATMLLFSPFPLFKREIIIIIAHGEMESVVELKVNEFLILAQTGNDLVTSY